MSLSAENIDPEGLFVLPGGCMPACTLMPARCVQQEAGATASEGSGSDALIALACILAVYVLHLRRRAAAPASAL